MYWTELLYRARPLMHVSVQLDWYEKLETEFLPSRLQSKIVGKVEIGDTGLIGREGIPD